MPVNHLYISAAIITFNEEKNIADCIQSLNWVDEIVVVDSLSTDATKEIALSYGAKVIDQPFLGHVQQKNFALQNCQYDWVIALDADERVSETLKLNIIQLLEKIPENQLAYGYRIPRRSFHLGRWIMHGGWYPDRRIRFFNRHYASWGGVDPHDKIILQGNTPKISGHLDHYVFRDLEHNVQQNNYFSSISAQILHKKKQKFSLIKLLLKPLFKFIETYFLKRGFLDGIPGLIISVGAAYSMFLKHAKLWEHQKIKLK